jgi:hypothetical protein
MTKYAYFPRIVKVLEIFYDWHWDKWHREIKGHRLIIGKYYVAEHSKTYPLKKGDCFIIKEKYDKYGR